MSFRKIIPFTAQHVIHETTLPFEQVQSRLYAELNKDQSGDVFSILRSVKSQEAFESVVAKYTGNDFLHFSEIHHHILLQYADGAKHPPNVIYTIGNPKIAQAVLKHNSYAAYNIPPRMLITEKPDHSGCIVYYQLPSSIMGVPVGELDPELRLILESLDDKIDKLATRITAA